MAGTVETCGTRTLERGRSGWGTRPRGSRGCRTAVGGPQGPPWERARASKPCCGELLQHRLLPIARKQGRGTVKPGDEAEGVVRKWGVTLQTATEK
eukprot:scaffold910_cov370-Pavlova_lutheri.AAC.2